MIHDDRPSDSPAASNRATPSLVRRHALRGLNVAASGTALGLGSADAVAGETGSVSGGDPAAWNTGEHDDE